MNNFKFVKSDGVFPFSDAASLLTHGTENVQDTFGPLTVFNVIFHSGGVLLISALCVRLGLVNIASHKIGNASMGKETRDAFQLPWCLQEHVFVPFRPHQLQW